jgi:hypothetical protein
MRSLETRPFPASRLRTILSSNREYEKMFHIVNLRINTHPQRVEKEKVRVFNGRRR